MLSEGVFERVLLRGLFWCRGVGVRVGLLSRLVFVWCVVFFFAVFFGCPLGLCVLDYVVAV